MPDINLLPEEERRAVLSKRLKTRVTLTSISALVIVLIVSVGVFGYWAVLTRTEKQLGEKISNLEKQIQNLSQLESLARVLKSKLSAIIVISAKSSNFEKILNDTSKVVPTGVTLSDLTVSEKSIVTLTGNAISATEFSNLISALTRPDLGGANFSDVAVESVSRDDKGIYKFSITAKLKGATTTSTSSSQ